MLVKRPVEPESERKTTTTFKEVVTAIEDYYGGPVANVAGRRGIVLRFEDEHTSIVVSADADAIYELQEDK